MPTLLDISHDLLPVQEVLEASLKRVEVQFKQSLDSDLPPLRRLCEHIERYRGKMLRPALVVLCGLGARPCRSGDPTPDDVSREHITIAAVCEMIHMATLVHDDVLDEADTRRGGSTVNGLHGNETAVILGDYLFSTAYRLCSSLDSQQAATLIGSTGMTLCAGELLQLHHRGNLSIDEPTYYEIIERKTASLIATACRLGATQSGASPDLAERFADFGRKLGVAFQIQDDLLDLLGSQDIVGKPIHRDVELGKLTLPLIHHLGAASPELRGQTLLLLSEADEAASARNALARALEETGSIQHARDAARRLVREAKRLLDPVPESKVKQFLLTMADAVVERSF